MILLPLKVPGHKGNLVFGKLNDVEVVCMQGKDNFNLLIEAKINHLICVLIKGRFHAYEGYSSALCTLPIKVFKMLNVDKIILTCAAGSVNRSYKVNLVNVSI